jgi:outer membrane protein TolC
VNPAAWNIDLRTLEVERDIHSLLLEGRGTFAPQEPLQVDALVIINRAQQFRYEAERIEDNLRPALDAYLSYGANGLNDRFDRSWTTTRDSDSSVARVGLLFSVQLDTELKNSRISAARLNADAEESRARAITLNSNVAWKETQRNINSLKVQVKEARKLSSLQNRTVNAERARFEQGRSTTFQLTTFEVNAADSQLRLYQLLANLRKAENRARSFTLEEGMTQ